ncbi:MAG: RNA methyltransferase [Bacteroidales bacterium]|nr:RNA methyltransferase [Bacteroidales bacterium]MDD2425995.1 RNA methyltransferase [Bacteroidales bacterium]MDD3989028.1 RNA methyltransferase [Bacteroidales bacterium]MDD4638640.1 RNA methyltransferase [Bacteroidales bacterium]
MFIETISSAKNPRIRELRELIESSRVRRERSLFVTEGRRELELCVKGDYEIETIFFNRELVNPESFREIKMRSCFALTPEIYSKLAYRGSTEGVIATVRPQAKTLENIILSDCPLIIVLESVEKPGNLGAVIRTADALGADAVIICDPLTDLYNPNIIRSSTGALFTTQCSAVTSHECFEWLKEKNINIITTELEASIWYYNCDMTTPCAIVMGSEAEGLSQFWRERAGNRIKIPMNGLADSLNVSVSAAIISFEALRQRNIKTTTEKK